MSKNPSRRALAVASAMLLSLGAAYAARETLVRLAANVALAETGLALTNLSGLAWHDGQASIDHLTLQLPSGLRLGVEALTAALSFPTGLAAPQLDTLTLGSAALLPATTDDTSTAATSEPLRLGALLTTLREFPLPHLQVDQLLLPTQPAPLTLTLQTSAGDLHLAGGNGELQVDAHFAQADALAPAAVDLALTNGGATLVSAHLALTPAGATYALQGNGALNVAGLDILLAALQLPAATLPLSAGSLQWDVAGSVADDLDGALAALAGEAAPASFTLGIGAGSTLTLPAGLVEGLASIDVQFRERAELTLATGAVPNVSSARLPLQVTSEWNSEPLSVDGVIALATCGLPHCTLDFDGAVALGVHSLQGQLGLAATDWTADTAHFALDTTALTLTGLPAWLPRFDVHASVQREPGALTFTTPLVLPGMARDTSPVVNGRYALTSGRIEAQLVLPSTPFDATALSLKSRLGNAALPFDLVGGTLAAALDLSWQPATPTQPSVLNTTLNATMQDLAGAYGDYFFSGLAGAVKADAELGPTLKMGLAPTTLTLARLDVGLPVSQVALQLAVERATQQVHIASLTASVLGGRVHGEQLVYDLNQPRNAMTLRFDGLQLASMLALANYDGVAANGAVSGELPLTLSATGVEVSGGILHADAPGGSIRYLAGAIGGGDPSLDLVNRALSNYQFESLTSNIDYSPAGELVLSMQLQGHNPELDGGQRVNLNLNLTDNIPSLLRSLQSTRAIEDFLQQQSL